MHRFLTLSQGASQTRTTPDAEFAGNDLFFQTDRGAKRQRKDTGKRMLPQAPFPLLGLVGYGVNLTLPAAIQLGLAGRVTARQVRHRQAMTRTGYTPSSAVPRTWPPWFVSSPDS